MISTLARITISFCLGIILNFEILSLLMGLIVISVFVVHQSKLRITYLKSSLILCLFLLSGHIFHFQFNINREIKLNGEKSISLCQFKVSKSSISEKGHSLQGKIKLNNEWIGAQLYSRNRNFAIQEGCLIELENVSLQKIKTSNFYYRVDFNRFLLLKNIQLKGSFEFCSYQSEVFDFESIFLRLRRNIKKCNKNYFGEHADLVNAICLGDKSELDLGSKNLFIDNGIAHVMAVSGLHIGIIFLIFSKLFSFLLRKNIIVSSILVLTFVWAFILITGAPVSALRAGTMILIYTAFKILDRKSEKLHILSFTALILLLFDPNQIYTAGFQLSFLALIGILYFTDYFLNLWSPKNYLVKYFWEITSVTLAVQITTLPLILFYFHQFPIHFLLTNFVAIPLAFVSLVFFILFLLMLWIPFVSEIISKVLYLIIDRSLAVLDWFSDYDFLFLKDLFLTKSSLLIYFGIVFILMNTKRIFYRYLIAASVFVCSMMISNHQENKVQSTYVFYDKGIQLLHQNGLQSHSFYLKNKPRMEYFHPIIRKQIQYNQISKNSEINIGNKRIVINPDSVSQLNENTIVIVSQNKVCEEILQKTNYKMYVPFYLKNKYDSERLIEINDVIEL